MESTGSYWQTLFYALQKAGFEVILVQGGQTKNVRGKKTDVLDCLWIQKLHALGLLSSSFLLSDYLQTLRTYYAHRDHLVAQTAMYITKMQKALRLLNIRLDIAIRDIAGKTGRAILEAILQGRRDPDGCDRKFLRFVIKQVQIRNRPKLLIRSYKGDVQYNCRSRYDTIREFQVGVLFDLYDLVLDGVSNIYNYKIG